ncbi:hypothetical protein MNEG_15664 [Monoraphidium neglectum]|uniref:Uncharacterized protein n=1 Tax=Monoraphidium neglectum TaxID=145388 RepID=A0A0D2LJZ0_9CHLO|nr:hypothetical protein MNEG_15664 [Monoraphidium neglectum]KIY92299.1 hypothetical protein MNEG_15664 [Monoraphidium neglectum]|eukprot:XP_013891319.1 hypothetical protein MNEG_15664 [Monoraphidium neglectum]
MAEYSPRGLANIIWALAKLQHYPEPELRALLLDTFVERLPTAVPQPAGAAAAADGGDADPADEAPPGSPPASPASSAAAEATADAFAAPGDAVPQLGAPADGAAAPGEATVAAQALLAAPPVPADGAPAAATAPPVTPLLSLTQVQALLTHLCANLSRAMVQTISNSLWAVVVLQHEHSWCMCGSLMQVQLLLHTFCQQPREALPGHIQPVIRCMSQLATACAVHNGDAWLMWQPPVLQRLLGHLFSQRSHMEQHHVSSVLRDVAQVACLLMLLQRRKLEASAKAEGRPPLGPRAADDMLSALAAGAGPPDTASTMLALGMLRPQLSDMGLLPSVQHLCGMLSLMASHNQAELDGRLTAAAAAVGAVPAGADVNRALSEDPLAAGPTAFALLTAPPPPPPVAPAAAPAPAADAHAQAQQAGEGLGVFSQAADQAARALAGGVGPGIGPGAAAGAGALPSAPTAAAGSIGSSSGSSGSLPANVEAAAAALRQQLALQSQQQGADSGTAAGGLGGSLLVGGALSALGHRAAASPAAAAPALAPAIPAPLTPQLQLLPHAGLRAAGQPGAPPQPHLAAAMMAGGGIPGRYGGGGAGGSFGPPPGSSTDVGMSADWVHQEAAAKQLTHHIVSAESVWALVDIYNANKTLMDSIHLTACITRLSKVLGSRPAANSPAQAMAEQLLPQIGQQLTPMLPSCNARGLANVLWGYGRLRMRPEDTSLVVLLQQFIKHLAEATSRDCAVVLWSLARLSESQAGAGVAPELLQRTL